MTSPMLKPGTVDWLAARLPHNDLITVPELAVAADVDSRVVDGWIDSGEIEAVDLGGATQHYWKMSRPSILEFWARRRLGLRLPATRRLPIQQTLFAQAPSGAGPAK